MNTRLVNTAAGVILAAQERDRTPAGIALALESAQLLMSPEVAAELEQLRAEVAELRARVVEAPAESVTVRPAGDVAPQVAKLRQILAGQRAALEDPHDSPLHHPYAKGRDLEYTPNTVAHVVAYRDPQRPQTLLCRKHGPRYIGMTPVTAEDLPDGGVCTYGGLSSLACGRDVLADGAELGGVQ